MVPVLAALDGPERAPNWVRKYVSVIVIRFVMRSFLDMSSDHVNNLRARLNGKAEQNHFRVTERLVKAD
jgi:hypothetical protein